MTTAELHQTSEILTRDIASLLRIEEITPGRVHTAWLKCRLLGAALLELDRRVREMELQARENV